MNISWFLLIVLILYVQVHTGESKRSFGIGRSRPKASSNLSVRRRGHTESNPVPKPAAAPQSHASKPVGPPPAYSPTNQNAKANINAAPPSYAQATGINHNNPSLNYPRQNYQPSAPNYGNSPHGGGLYSNQGNGYGGYPSGGHMPGYGHSMPSYGNAMPSYGHSMPNYGMGGGMMPNYGMGGGMMQGGMMGGGMMGGGMMQGGMYKQKSSLLPMVASNALTGLAVWQLARAFGGSHNHGHHESTQHIYHHHDTPQQTNLQAAAPSAQYPQAPQVSQDPQAPLLQQPIPSLPTNVDQSSRTYGEPNVPNVTPVPEFDNQFPFSTIHPSLFPYAAPVQPELLDYWDKSHKRILNTTDLSDFSTTEVPQ